MAPLDFWIIFPFAQIMKKPFYYSIFYRFFSNRRLLRYSNITRFGSYVWNWYCGVGSWIHFRFVHIINTFRSAALGIFTYSAYSGIFWMTAIPCTRQNYWFSWWRWNSEKKICLTDAFKGSQKLKVWWKTEMLLEGRIVGQRSKFWSKIEILVKNWNFGQNWKCWSKVAMSAKFWSKSETLVKSRNVGQRSKFWSKIEI